MKVFSKARLHVCNRRTHGAAAPLWNELSECWASKCDGQPSDGITVIGTNGIIYEIDPDWCEEVPDVNP
jgi:hypothetical protein